MCSCELRSAAVSSKISVSLGGPIGVRCGYGADGRPADFIFLFSLACKLQERGSVRWSAGVFYGENRDGDESGPHGKGLGDWRIIDGGTRPVIGDLEAEVPGSSNNL